MSNLALIQPQVANFHTCQVTDWLDGLPLIAQPAPGGAVAGSANVGQGSLVVAAVDVSADLGVHVATVTRIAGGLAAFTVTDPDGDITGRGVVGLPLYAGGITLTLGQVAGQTGLAVGDTFAIAVVPAPIDLTGLRFDLDARVSAGAAGIALAASTAASVPTIVNGGASGALAMQVAQATMAALPPSAPSYPYNIYATDPAIGRRVVAFYGVIAHAALLQAS